MREPFIMFVNGHAYHVPLDHDDLVTILIGPNGCGKSTVLKRMASTWPDSTTVRSRRILGEEGGSDGQWRLCIIRSAMSNAVPGTLVLLDDAEMHLHIAVQVGLVKELVETAKQRNLFVVLSTHSPDVIHDRWDLVYEMKEERE